MPADKPRIVTPPNGVDCLAQATGGYSHSLAIGSDGNLYSWGYNYYNQLGRNPSTSNPHNRPGIVTPPNGIHFTQAIAGGYHSLAFGSDGNLYSWGYNKYGQLGRNTTDSQDIRPGIVTPPKGITFTQAFAGLEYSMAFGSDGNLYSWGRNNKYQLGHNTSDSQDIKPGIVTPPRGITFTQAFAGFEYSMAFGSDGNLYSWGDNSDGQLGRNNGSQDIKPGIVTPPQGVSFTQAIAGDAHSLAIGSDGNLYSWGDNSDGQLGRNSGSQNFIPGIVTPPRGITFTQAFAGFEYSMAFGSDGNLYSWGYDTLGQLGRETSGATNESPGKVAFPDKPIITSIKFDQSPGTNLKANTDGTWSVTTPAHEKGLVDVTISWTMNGEQPDLHFVYRYTGPKYKVTFDSAGGSSIDAQSVIEGDQAKRPAIDPTKPGWLFDGWFIGNTAYDFSIPVTGKVTLTAHWSKADTRWNIDKDNGPESGGQTVTLTPPPARGIRFNQADAGDIHSGAIGSDGNIYTWGDNQKNQLGRTVTSSTPADRPNKVETPAGITFTQVSAGYGFSVALGSDGNIYTWGDNSRGQLGRNTAGNTKDSHPGKADTPTGITFTQTSAGGSHAVALSSDGNIYTWGDNRAGRLGRNTTGTSDSKPGKLDTSTDVIFTRVSAGWGHTAALDMQGNVYTWGDNTHGELGRSTPGSTQDIRPGKADTPAGIIFTQASAGGSHSVAVSADGSLYTWGNSDNGRLGRDTNSTPADKPGKADTPTGITFTQASAGGWHTVALSSDGSLYTWGDNNYGRLGRDTSKTPADKPGKADTPAGITFTQASAGAWYCMALGTDGNLYSWGDNTNGQLGRNTGGSTQDASPAKVAFPGRGVPTQVQFDNATATGLTGNPDGTWKVTTPTHMPGTITVNIDWTLNGAAPTRDTSNHYRYNSISVLPLTGGTGLTLLLMAGLLAATGAAAIRRHRLETLTQQK